MPRGPSWSGLQCEINNKLPVITKETVTTCLVCFPTVHSDRSQPLMMSLCRCVKLEVSKQQFFFNRSYTFPVPFLRSKGQAPLHSNDLIDKSTGKSSQSTAPQQHNSCRRMRAPACSEQWEVGVTAVQSGEAAGAILKPR